MQKINSLCGVFLLEWNKACCLKLIWLLFFQAGSVWVAWFREEILGGSINNLWTTKPSPRFSWQVNKILKLSREIYPWVKLRVENGVNCRFWSDNWSSLGCIRTYLGNATLGIPSNITLASLYCNERWQLPPARSEAQVNMQALLTTINLTQQDDYYEWEIGGKLNSRYSMGQVYNYLREEGPTVPWFHTVWNKRGIPKQSFMAWLIVLDRCPTRDRILRWGLQTDPFCLLCNLTSETRNHLYFDCNFSWEVWGTMGRRCGITPMRTWSQSMNQLQALSRSSPSTVLTLLCWQSCLYWLWSERNSRLHRQVFRSPDAISRLIDRQIKDKILIFRTSNPALASRLMQQWLT